MKRLLVIVLGATMMFSFGCVQLRIVDEDGVLQERNDRMERDRGDRTHRDRGPRSDRRRGHERGPRSYKGCKNRCMEEFHHCRETGASRGPGNSGCAHDKNACKDRCQRRFSRGSAAVPACLMDDVGVGEAPICGV